MIDFTIDDANPYVELLGSFDGVTSKSEEVDIINFDAVPGVYAPELHGNDGFVERLGTHRKPFEVDNAIETFNVHA